MLTVDQLMGALRLDRELRKAGSALNERDLPRDFLRNCEVKHADLAETCKDIFAENEKRYLETAMKND